MEFYVGTSGWYYSWNEEKNLSWYVNNSHLNAVELNASFYRFPFPNQIKSWAQKGSGIRFSIKVSRRITHIHRLNQESYPIWDAFVGLFEPLQSLIDFFLFQFPASFTTKQFDTFVQFFTHIPHSFHSLLAIEMRNPEWYQKKWIKELEQIPVVLVSVDSPDLQNKIILSNNIIYMRFHGRTEWYHHNYLSHELEEAANQCCSLKPEKIYAFFNNDHFMLDNAQFFYHLLKERA